MFKKCTLTCPWIQWHRHRPSSLSVFGSRCRHLNCGQPTDSLRLHSRLRAVLRHVNSTAVSFWTCDVCQDVVDGGWISTWMAMTIQQKVGAGICKNHVSAPRPPNKKNRFQIWERRAGGRGIQEGKAELLLLVEVSLQVLSLSSSVHPAPPPRALVFCFKWLEGCWVTAGKKRRVSWATESNFNKFSASALNLGMNYSTVPTTTTVS